MFSLFNYIFYLFYLTWTRILGGWYRARTKRREYAGSRGGGVGGDEVGGLPLEGGGWEKGGGEGGGRGWDEGLTAGHCTYSVQASIIDLQDICILSTKTKLLYACIVYIIRFRKPLMIQTFFIWPHRIYSLKALRFNIEGFKHISGWK